MLQQAVQNGQSETRKYYGCGCAELPRFCEPKLNATAARCLTSEARLGDEAIRVHASNLACTTGIVWKAFLMPFALLKGIKPAGEELRHHTRCI